MLRAVVIFSDMSTAVVKKIPFLSHLHSVLLTLGHSLRLSENFGPEGSNSNIRFAPRHFQPVQIRVVILFEIMKGAKGSESLLGELEDICLNRAEDRSV